MGCQARSAGSLMFAIRETLHKSLAIAFLLGCFASGAPAQHLLMRGDTNFVQVADCPIETPYAPEPDRSRSTFDQESQFFPMDGHLYHRIQFSGLGAETDLEIIWTPDNPGFPNRWHPPMSETWIEKTAHLSVAAGGPHCFYNWFFSPQSVPGHLEVRSKIAHTGLRVSFSDRTWDHEGQCPAKPLCPLLVRNLHQCKANPRSMSCSDFIDIADGLTSSYQCRRQVDFEPVPGIWVCDELTGSQVLEDTLHLLKRLKTAKARQFYLSGHFRGVLDGALSEEYMGDPGLVRNESDHQRAGK
jgi:hypothetical protein